MARNTSISLGDHFEKFIQREVSSGRYGSVSEVIRTALRLLETEEQKLAALRSALMEGEQSGIIEDFDPEQHLRSLRAKAK
jgi:antitoxin ParD1/3/4